MNHIIERELPEGVWKDLLPHVLSIIEDIKSHGTAVNIAAIVNVDIPSEGLTVIAVK